MDIKRLNFDREIYQKKNSKTDNVQNTDQNTLIFGTNPIKSVTGLEISAQNKPQPTCEELAGEIMEKIKTGDKKALTNSIKNIPSNLIFDVLNLCYAQQNKKDILEKFFNQGTAPAVVGKILEYINNRNDIPPMYRAYIITQVAGLEPLSGSKFFEESLDCAKNYLNHKYDEQIKEDLEQFQDKNYSYCINFRSSACFDPEYYYQKTIKNYNKKYKTNIKDIFSNGNDKTLPTEQYEFLNQSPKKKIDPFADNYTKDLLTGNNTNITNLLGQKSFDNNTTNQDLISKWVNSSSKEEFMTIPPKNGVKHCVDGDNLRIDETPNSDGFFERKFYNKSGKLEKSVNMIVRDGKSFYYFESNGKVFLMDEKNYETTIYGSSEAFTNNKPQEKLFVKKDLLNEFLQKNKDTLSQLNSLTLGKGLNDFINKQRKNPGWFFEKKELYTYSPNGKAVTEFITDDNDTKGKIQSMKLYDNSGKELAKFFYNNEGKIFQIEQNGEKYKYSNDKLDYIIKNIQGENRLIKFFEDGKTISQLSDFFYSYNGKIYTHDHLTISFDKNKNLQSYFIYPDPDFVVTNDENISYYDGIVGLGIQSLGDCYLLSVINSIKSLTQGNDILSKMVKADPDGGFTVTFPGAQKLAKDLANIKHYNGRKLNPKNISISGVYKFTKEDLEKIQNRISAIGDLDVGLIEAAYERFRREESATIYNYFGTEIPIELEKRPAGLEALLLGMFHDKVNNDNSYFINIGGNNNIVKYILLGEDVKIEKVINQEGTTIPYNKYQELSDENNLSPKENLEQLIENFTKSNNTKKLNLCKYLQKYIDDKQDGKKEIAATCAFRFEKSGHAIAITDVNENYVFLQDSNSPHSEIKCPIDWFIKYVEAISFATIPFDENNHASYDNIETIANPQDIKAKLPSNAQKYNNSFISPISGSSTIDNIIKNLK